MLHSSSLFIALFLLFTHTQWILIIIINFHCNSRQFNQITMSRPKFSPILPALFVLFISFHVASNTVNAQVDHSSLEHMSETESIGFSFNATPFTSLEAEMDLEEGGLDEQSEDGMPNRRPLHYYYRSSPRHYYISYLALSADRIPCPPRSGRSYYYKQLSKN